MAGSHSFDHELKVDSTTKKFYLLKDEKGASLYTVSEGTSQGEQLLKFGMTDWRGGHGQFAKKKPDVYLSGQSIDTTQEGKVILGPLIYQVGLPGALDSNPLYFCWFSAISKLMVATANKVYWYDGTNLVMKEDFSAIAPIYDMVEFNGYLYIALGTVAAYYYSADGDAFTACTLTDHHAFKFLVAPNAAGTSNVLWKVLTPNQIASNTSGINGGAEWSSAAYIGDTSNNITNLFLVNDNLMVGRTDNLYNYDTDGGIHAYMDDLKHNRTTKNFQYVTQWQTATYHSLGTGLGEITGSDTFQPIGPLTDIDDIGKVGTCVGLTSDKDFMYVAMDEGTNTIIYKGREIRRGGILRWEWCPFVFISDKACVGIRVVQHSATDRRLWFGYDLYAGYVILSDNPTADSAARFAASGFLRMSYDYGTNPYWDKMWQSVVTETKGCAANITITPKYWKDTDTSATDLTAAISTNGVVKTDLTTPLSCKRITFEVDLATNNSSITPELTYFEARGVERPERIKIHEAVYAIGDTPSRKTETMRQFFRDARVTTNLIRFADLRYGESTAASSYVWVVMVPGYPQEVEIVHEKGKAPELGIKCRFIEVNFATGDYVPGTSAYVAAILADGSKTFTANQSMGGYSLTSVANIKYSATSELTIAVGAIVPTQFLHTVDTEADAASDDLDTITNTNSLSWVILRAENGARTVVVKHNTGNIWLRGSADISLDDAEDGVLLFWDTVNSKWFDVVGLSGVTDHGLLTGLTDDDHTQYIKHSLATAANDFLVASGSGAFAKQTLAQTLTTLGKAAASGLASLNASTKVVEQPASISDFLETTPTDGLTTKTNDSNWAFDHNARDATAAVQGHATAAQITKLDGIGAGAQVTGVTGTAPIVSSGGAAPAISITAATTIAAGSMSSADKTKLDGIEAAADVTDATNVNAAGAVMESDYDAQTILAATTDNTPVALTVNVQEVVGRLTAGNIDGIALGIADDNVVQIDHATVADDDYAKFTAGGLEGRSYAETKTDLSLNNVENLKVKLDATAAPAVTNDVDEGYSVGSRWFDVTNDKEYTCLDATDGAAVWKETTLGAGVGDVATDAIWDAKGDLAVGTGANTASKLGAGSDGQILSALASEATGLVWLTVDNTAGGTDASTAPVSSNVLYDHVVSLTAHSLGLGARVYNSANLTIPDSTWTALAFNSEDYDTDVIHDNVTNNSRLTCKTAGKYIITGHAFWDTNTNGMRSSLFKLNGSTAIAYAQLPLDIYGNGTSTLTTIYNLAVNNYVEFFVYANVSPSILVMATSTLIMQRIG